MQCNYLILLLSSLLFLSGCGLETEQESEQTGQAKAATVGTHPLLPLTDGSGIMYSDASLGQIRADINYEPTESALRGSQIFKLEFNDSGFNNTGFNLGLLFSSSPTQVQWIGVDGPIDISYNSTTITLESLRFTNPITIIGNSSDGSTSATTVTNDLLLNQTTSTTVDYQISSSDTLFDPSNTGYGTLPAHRVTITSSIQLSLGNIAQTLPGFTTELSFVKGIGIVSHLGDYQDISLESKIDSLIDLPNTIWFNLNAGNPAIASGSEATFKTNYGNLLASEYRIYNQAQLSALDWIDITENSASDSYDVQISYTENLPTELTGVQVIFEHRQNPGQRLSGNVTLLD